MTLEEIRTRASRHIGFKAVLNFPYKLCDYRPIFGLIFEDYLSGYDFWGHVDPDVIYGDLGHFITDYLLNKYGRLFRRGHLTLYRNTDEINHFALHELPGFNISYRDVFSTNLSMHYDELSLAENLFSSFTDWGGGSI